MKARFKFSEQAVAALPLTLEMTTTLPEWQTLANSLERLSKEPNVDHRNFEPLRQCIDQLLRAVNEATGAGYRTRAYQYAWSRDGETPDDASTN